MFALPARLGRLTELWRYYQAGIVNTAVGYGMFAAFVHFGLNIFLAQICSHVLGAVFNYLTYSRHVFRESAPARLRFTLSYIGNYFAGLLTLWIISHFIFSPYLAGFVTLVIVSLLNYFALKHLVFHKRSA